MTDPNGVVIRNWRCPIGWHRYVKWHGDDAYCDEPGCDRSSLESRNAPAPRIGRITAPVPRSVITIHLPGEE